VIVKMSEESFVSEENVLPNGRQWCSDPHEFNCPRMSRRGHATCSECNRKCETDALKRERSLRLNAENLLRERAVAMKRVKAEIAHWQKVEQVVVAADAELEDANETLQVLRSRVSSRVSSRNPSRMATPLRSGQQSPLRTAAAAHQSPNLRRAAAAVVREAAVPRQRTAARAPATNASVATPASVQRVSPGYVCAICMDTENAPFGITDGCGHKFHTICYARSTLHDVRCPLCRSDYSGFTPEVPAHAAQEQDDLSPLEEEENEPVDIDGPPSPTTAVTALLDSLQVSATLDQLNREYLASAQ